MNNNKTDMDKINQLYSEIKENNQSILNKAIEIGNLLNSNYTNKKEFMRWIKYNLPFEYSDAIKFITLYNTKNDSTIKESIIKGKSFHTTLQTIHTAKLNEKQLGIVLSNIEGLITGLGRKLHTLLLSKNLPGGVDFVLDKIQLLVGLVEQIKQKEKGNTRNGN